MNKTLKRIAIITMVVSLGTGAAFAQPRGNGNPEARMVDFPARQNNSRLLGIVDEVTTNSLTFIDMDGKSVTVYVTPFTDIQDIFKARTVDPKSKDARAEMSRTYISLNQVKKGHWVKVHGYRTEQGKNVADYIEIIRMSDSGAAK